MRKLCVLGYRILCLCALQRTCNEMCLDIHMETREVLASYHLNEMSDFNMRESNLRH